MGANSKIEWCDHTFNPWFGCTKVSPACKHCYAEALTRRTGLVVWGPQAERRISSESNWKQPLKWAKAAKAAGVRHRVFCASLADVFEDRQEVKDARLRLFSLIEGTPDLDWLLLTKRPENMLSMLPVVHLEKPWPNVWLGTTVEDQQRADERIPHLLRTPAAKRFLSVEPMLGPVDLVLHGIDWVICGGESGHGARPMRIEWVESIIDQCREANVKCFVKQLGEYPVWAGAKCSPIAPARGKCADPDEWPESLRVREFPDA